MNVPLARALAAAVGAVVIVSLGSCHDSELISDPSAPPVTMLGVWSLTVTETTNTCADDVAAPIAPTLFLEQDGERFKAQVNNVDDSGWCWVMPFDEVADNVLHTEYGGRFSTMECAAECGSLTFSTVDVSFQPGGAFEAIERVTFSQQTAGCDVAACGFPCVDDSFHGVWGFGMPRCGFACEVTYRWTGTRIGDEFPPGEQCRLPGG